MSDLYTITLQDGTVLRWTSADFLMTVGNNSFAPQGSGNAPIIERGNMTRAAGLAVDTLTVKLLCGNSVQLAGVPMQLAAHNGAFDSAKVQIDRAFMPTWGDTSAGTLGPFIYTVAAVDPTSTTVTLTAKDLRDTLSVMMPRNVFLPMCAHLVFDAGCGLNKALFTVNTSVGANPTAAAFTAAASTGKPAGYFETGVLTMTSGQASGSSRAVRTFDGTTFTLAVPLPTPPAAGDTFTVTAGCPRDYGTCGSRFNNQGKFRGFKDIPVAESSL